MRTPFTKPTLLLAVSTFFLAACASTDGLHTTSRITSPDTLAARESLAGLQLTPAAWPTETWWTALGDPQLDELVQRALADQPSLRAAEARVRQAQASAGLSASAMQPQAQFGLKSTDQRFSENSVYPKTLAGHVHTIDDAQLGVAQSLDFWGRNQAAVDAAIDRVHAAEVDAQAARLVLASSVVHVYLRLDTAHAQRDLALRTLAQREQVLALVRRRVAAHLDSNLELNQAEAALPALREQVAATDETIALAGNQLAALQGQGPDARLALRRPALGAAAAAFSLPSRLPAELLGRRPDVVAERWRIEALGHDIREARASFYPNVTLNAFVGFQSVGLGDFLSMGSRLLGAGPAITLPVFDGGRLRANLSLHQAAYDAAVEQYDATLVSALREVVDQLVSIESLKAQRAEQDQALALSRRALALARDRYAAGLANYLQVLTAEAQVLQQERAVIASTGRQRELQVNLIQALGGGLTLSVPSASADAS